MLTELKNLLRTKGIYDEDGPNANGEGHGRGAIPEATLLYVLHSLLLVGVALVGKGGDKAMGVDVWCLGLAFLMTPPPEPNPSVALAKS